MQGLEHDDPRQAGRFRLLARAGSGGMAVVYLGRSASGRAAAVKVMHADLAGDPEHRARFRREVAATRAAGGPYGPGLLDADPDAPRPWMATEFLPAVSLRDAVRRTGPLPADAVRSLAAGLAEALALIHRAGYVHLDLKPANVLLTADGPRVIDFGIAAERDGTGGTAPGTPAGSRGYMSPEQEAGEPIGPPSDIYSLGCTLAFACTGAPPAERSVPVADEGLRTAVAECLRSAPDARPEPAELAGRLAPREGQAAWPPPPVAAEIRRQAAAMENPPAPRPRPAKPRRPRWALLSAAGALAVGCLAAGVLLLNASGGAEAGGSPSPTAPSPTAQAAAPATPSPPAERTRVLEFYLTGDVTLTSLTYTINGKSTTLKDVELPWRTAVDIPAAPGSAEWSIKYRHPRGEVGYRVVVDRIMNGYGGGGGNTSGGSRGTA
ncbi:serine/threonine protein kinase [Actinomadura madurae]|uniref:serine/threonine-protein kinase n=1 Tax=Actinomadura madurae TaxID=1993 RepID=UPI002026B3E4|nr:serine/threonine-protein kinase [Actinomadura madurae]URN08770.1 serine/threonine protein kinase [Actinomadura madurae]